MGGDGGGEHAVRSRAPREKLPSVSQDARLRVLLLGGFEVWHHGRQLRGFESQKVRALLAYLLLQRGRSFSREALASLLWPERNESSARRNLRQALYNLRETLPADDAGRPLVLLDGQSARANPAAAVWIDVEAMAAALRPDPAGARGLAAHQLAAAANLYRGDFLAGFSLEGCQEFDEWLGHEQERLREEAMGALRALVAALAARGDHRLAIQYTRRLVAMDPLSEDGHRDLMQLYAATGQRNRALSHYRDVRAMLARELGVEPLRETAELFETLLAEAAQRPAEAERGIPIRPVVPLIGRDDAIERMGAAWVAALDGEARATVVEGEEGIGKTRLVRTFLDMATTHRPAVVLTGRCADRFPQLPYEPFAHMLRQLLAPAEGDDGRPAPAMGAEPLRALARIVPELARAGSSPVPAPAGGVAGEQERMFAAVGAAFAAAAGGSAAATARPLVLFLDDVQWADPGTLELLDWLAAHPPAAPVWLIAAGTHVPHLVGLRRAGPSRPARIRLRRLAEGDLLEVARSLVAPAQVPDLLDALEASDGLPLAVTAIVNSLWDQGALQTAADGAGWNLAVSAAELQRVAGTPLDDLIRERFRRLPASVRRTAVLAATAGPLFDVDLLSRADDEHPGVVEIGVEVLLERWLVRLAGRRWNAGGLESGVAPRSRGLRGGVFEFDHDRIRRVIAGEVGPERSPTLHARIARALTALHPPDADGLVEELAYHALLAHDWDAAVGHLVESLADTLVRCAPANAVAVRDRALEAVDRITASAGDPGERARLLAVRRRVTTLAAGIPGNGPGEHVSPRS